MLDRPDGQRRQFRYLARVDRALGRMGDIMTGCGNANSLLNGQPLRCANGAKRIQQVPDSCGCAGKPRTSTDGVIACAEHKRSGTMRIRKSAEKSEVGGRGNLGKCIAKSTIGCRRIGVRKQEHERSLYLAANV